VPPHSIEAESSVLGGLLLDNGAWDRVADLINDSDFYRYEHRLTYGAIAALVNASKPADVVTVFEHLQSQGKADEAGGLAYLNSLAQYVPSAANIRRYAEIVRERAILRKLVAPATKSPPTPSTRRASRWPRSWTRPSRRSSRSAKKARG
jgi:replicative DNA helicase